MYYMKISMMTEDGYEREVILNGAHVILDNKPVRTTGLDNWFDDKHRLVVDAKRALEDALEPLITDELNKGDTP